MAGRSMKDVLRDVTVDDDDNGAITHANTLAIFAFSILASFLM